MPKVEPRRLPPRVQRKKAKGKTYYYFVAGQTVEGKTVLKRLPDIKDIEFGPLYAAAMHAHGRKKPNVRAGITVKEMAEKWELSKEFKRKAPGTQRVYTLYLPVFLKQFGHAPAGELARTDVLALMDEMTDRTGAANMTLSVIGSLYRWGRQRNLVTINPTADIKPFDTKDYEPWPDDLLAEALSCDDAFIRSAVGLLYYTAQRIGDVASMQWGKTAETDARIDAGRVYVTQEKTGTGLDFPVHDLLRPILGPDQESGFVLAYRNRGYSIGTIRDRIQTWAKDRGHKIVPHGLRKNAVNKLLEVGCSVAETTAISGQSLKVVEHYAKRRNRSTLGSAAMLRWGANEP